MKKLTDDQIKFIYDNSDKPYSWIAEKSGISQGTISFYLSTYRKDNNLPRPGRFDSKSGGRAKRIQQEKISSIAKNYADDLWFKYNANHKFIYGLLLYWCEGTRKSSFSFSNTNPVMLNYFISWVTEFFPSLNIKYRVKYPPSADTQRISDYWTLTLGFAPVSSSLAKNTRSAYGVVQLEITGFKFGERKFVPYLEERLSSYIQTVS